MKNTKTIKIWSWKAALTCLQAVRLYLVVNIRFQVEVKGFPLLRVYLTEVSRGAIDVEAVGAFGWYAGGGDIALSSRFWTKLTSKNV